jgi:PAT family beta-lactamase induction signal transducer AmpG
MSDQDGLTVTRPPRVPFNYLLLFAALYAIQGVTVAYFFNFSHGYMSAAGISDTVIAGVQSIVLLPMMFKFLAGPLSDRLNFFGLGHRKPYIKLGLMLQTVCLALVTMVNPTANLTLFAGLFFFMVVGLALYDTVCDGMVIEVCPEEDRTRVQGILMASRFIAAMVCSVAFGQWLDYSGNGPGKGEGVLWACALLGFVPLALVFSVSEPHRGDNHEKFNWRALKVLIKPSALVLLAFGAIYSTISYAIEVNLSAYYASPGLGMGSGEIGAFGAMRYIGRAVGALAVPLLAKHMSRRWLVAFGVLSLAITSAGQALVSEDISAGTWGFLFGAANGWNDALFCVLAMEAAHPKMAASTYALLMAVSNVSLIGGWLFAVGVATCGAYSPVFIVMGVLMLVVLPMVRTLGRSLAYDS